MLHFVLTHSSTSKVSIVFIPNFIPSVLSRESPPPRARTCLSLLASSWHSCHLLPPFQGLVSFFPILNAPPLALTHLGRAVVSLWSNSEGTAYSPEPLFSFMKLGHGMADIIFSVPFSDLSF